LATLLYAVPAASSDRGVGAYAQPREVSVDRLGLVVNLPVGDFGGRCTVVGIDISRNPSELGNPVPHQLLPVLGTMVSTRPDLLGLRSRDRGIMVRTYLSGADVVVTDDLGSYDETLGALVFTHLPFDRSTRNWPELTDLVWYYTLPNCDPFRLTASDVEYLLRTPYFRPAALTWLWMSLQMEQTGGSRWPERSHTLDGFDLLGDLVAWCRHPKGRQCSAAIRRIWSETGDGPQGY
jgi:hypothetical protein